MLLVAIEGDRDPRGDPAFQLTAVHLHQGADAIEEIFASSSRDRMTAARKALAYLQAGHDPTLLIDAARRLVFLKGDDPHDYKFSSAVLEDVYSLPEALRPQFMAASMYHLHGSGDSDNTLIKRARTALAKA